MLVRRLIAAPSSTFGCQSIIVRTKKNVWGTYGYSHMGNYDTPDKYPLISKLFHIFLTAGITLPMVDWAYYWPKITARYEKMRDTIPFLRPDPNAPKEPSLLDKIRIQP